MTRRERLGIYWFVVVCCGITASINWAIAQSGQPRPSLRGDWDIVEFENGSQWYIKEGSIHALWAVPRQDQEKLGFATRAYGAGFEISMPMETTQFLRQIYQGEQQQLDFLLKRIEQVEKGEP